jgi:hypothetical protein
LHIPEGLLTVSVKMKRIAGFIEQLCEISKAEDIRAVLAVYTAWVSSFDGKTGVSSPVTPSNRLIL